MSYLFLKNLHLQGFQPATNAKKLSIKIIFLSDSLDFSIALQLWLLLRALRAVQYYFFMSKLLMPVLSNNEMFLISL